MYTHHIGQAKECNTYDTVIIIYGNSYGMTMIMMPGVATVLSVRKEVNGGTIAATTVSDLP